MAKLTSEDIKKMADAARDEINKKYGIDDDDLEYVDLNEEGKGKKEYREVKKSKPHKKRNTHKVKVRNNDVYIGEANLFLLNIKKVMVVMGMAGLVVVSFVAGRASKETKKVNYAYNVLSESYFKEPTYNGIKYTVKAGENVWSIVKKYENDEGRIATLVDDILRVNKINGRSLQAGEEITLVGVPSSMLYLFDYTDNYNLLDPIVEVNVRIDFLNKVKEKLSSVEAATTYLMSIDRILDNWDSYKYSYVPGEESEEFNLILTELREVCEEASEYGYDYDFNKKAYPISVVPDHERKIK